MFVYLNINYQLNKTLIVLSKQLNIIFQYKTNYSVLNSVLE